MGYIVRIDKPKNSTKGTHGWQVRIHTGKNPRKYYSKLFSDGRYGSRGKALIAAEAYLEEYELQHPELAQSPIPPNKPFLKDTLTRRNTSGINGVFRSHQFYSWDKERIPRYYWGASCPTGPDGKYFAKRFYVATHGEEEAKRLAIEFRKMWEEAVEAGEEALAEFFEREHYDKIKEPFYWRDEI